MIDQITGENLNFTGPATGKVGNAGGGAEFGKELLSELEALANSSDVIGMAKRGIMKSAHAKGINIVNPGKELPRGKIFSDDDVEGKFPAFDLLKKMNADEIVELLQGQISAKGMDLENLEADKQSLHELKEFFKGLGFNEGDIEEIGANFSGKAKLKDLLKSMSKLEKDEEDTVLMDVSSVPFIKAIMTHLGVDEKQIEGLLSDTRIRNFGIDANKLLAKLNKFIKDNNYNTPVPGQFAQTQAHHLMDRIDLDGSDFDGPITLAKFAAELKNLVDSTVKDRSDNNNLNEKLDKFFGKIKISKKAVEESSSKFAKQQPGMIDGILGAASTGVIEGDLSNYALLEKVMEGMVEQTEKNDININMIRDKMLESLRENEKTVDPTLVTDAMKELKAQNDFTPVAPKGSTQRNLPAFVMDQVSRQLVKSVKKGDNSLQINIKPPRLGKLQVSLENASKGLRISIIAEHSATKDMLAAQVNELRSLIVDQGINVDSIDVQINQNFNKNLAQQGNDFHSSKEKRDKMVQNIKSRGGAAEVASSSESSRSKSVKRGSGNLDLVA